jgi:hypothetical protein
MRRLLKGLCLAVCAVGFVSPAQAWWAHKSYGYAMPVGYSYAAAPVGYSYGYAAPVGYGYGAAPVGYALGAAPASYYAAAPVGYGLAAPGYSYYGGAGMYAPGAYAPGAYYPPGAYPGAGGIGGINDLLAVVNLIDKIRGSGSGGISSADMTKIMTRLDGLETKIDDVQKAVTSKDSTLMLKLQAIQDKLGKLENTDLDKIQRTLEAIKAKTDKIKD